MQELSENSSGGRRILRFNLTDGISEIPAIEYSHIPSIPDDVVPGTKVFLFTCTEMFGQVSGLTCFYYVNHSMEHYGFVSKIKIFSEFGVDCLV